MIQLSRSAYPFAALSEPGLIREMNEDRFSVTSFQNASRPRVRSLLAVICDGVGGEQAGEVAAEMAVNLITGSIAKSSGEDPVMSLQSAVQQASAAIRLEAQNSESRRGMASTAACVWIIGRRLFTATVGDSRIYLLRTGQIAQLSTDHTWLQEALDSGILQENETENHPNAHVIRRFLGSENPPEVDFRIRSMNGANADQGMELQPGDILFLCSDGCSDLVKPEEILENLTHFPLQQGLDAVKKLAYERGGKDNITMIAVQIPAGIPSAIKRMRNLRLILFAAGVALAAIIGLYLGWKSQQEKINEPSQMFTPEQFSGTLASPMPTASETPSVSPSPYQMITPTFTGTKPGG